MLCIHPNHIALLSRCHVIQTHEDNPDLICLTDYFEGSKQSNRVADWWIKLFGIWCSNHKHFAWFFCEEGVYIGRQATARAFSFARTDHRQSLNPYVSMSIIYARRCTHRKRESFDGGIVGCKWGENSDAQYLMIQWLLLSFLLRVWYVCAGYRIIVPWSFLIGETFAVVSWLSALEAISLKKSDIK